jgi:pimeloyl-ACP methyl ester carboxylesterase
MQNGIGQLEFGDGRTIAFRHQGGRPPHVVFLAGLRSDMAGTKAELLAEHCRERGRRFTRFDYRGHGQSSGRFEEGCISDWLADTLLVLDRVVQGPCLLVGSSMGGWVMLLAALARPAWVEGLVGVAAAPDFTARLIEPTLDDRARAALARDGIFLEPSEYGEPLPITRHLLEDGRRHLLLGRPLPIRCPVHLLHGQADPDVPWQLSLELAAKLESPSVTVELIKDGDHRLSRPSDLKRLAAALERVAESRAA